MSFLQHQTGQVFCDEFSSQQKNTLVYFLGFFPLHMNDSAEGKHSFESLHLTDIK